jgi:hypothetical protein
MIGMTKVAAPSEALTGSVKPSERVSAHPPHQTSRPPVETLAADRVERPGLSNSQKKIKTAYAQVIDVNHITAPVADAVIANATNTRAVAAT